MVLPLNGATRKSLPLDILLERFDLLCFSWVLIIRRGNEKSSRRFSIIGNLFVVFGEETLVGDKEESLRGKLEREREKEETEVRERGRQKAFLVV